MSTRKYLSKSLFKTGYECPGKLFYYAAPDVYGNKNHYNEFLRALAKGGFQVGALAKLYYPEGVDLEELRTEEAIAKTQDLLSRDTVTIFEAAIQTGPFLVRVDILEKTGNQVSLIEVKSKSFNSSEHSGFFTKDGKGIYQEWESYLVDLAFQTLVAREAFPDWIVSPFLMLADKSKQASIDGLHQLFRIESSDLRNCKIRLGKNISADELGERILSTIEVSDEVDYFINEFPFPTEQTLPEFANYLASHHQAGTQGVRRISSLCKNCEFRIGDELKSESLKSGFEECWRQELNLNEADFKRGNIFDVWRLTKIEYLLSNDKFFFEDLTLEDLQPKSKSKNIRKLAPADRQWIQVQKKLSRDSTPYIDIDGIKGILDSIVYPIHCIDFETTMSAIPFHKGRRPYEQIAFQFSHHVLHEDGQVAHVDQFLDMRPGTFPNFDFVRRLKESLTKDQGTIFRYAAHENTVLRQIRDQLVNSQESDRDDLVAFIDLITKPKKSDGGQAGARSMIDLLEMILDHYYHPLMGGSNSIKKVIPAVLEESGFLRKKYSKPIYGKGREIPSLNFDEMTWIQLNENDEVIDPYKRLPPVFDDLSRDLFEGENPMFDDDSIDDGGAAMTAWGRMQFTEMKDVERVAIQSALLKYCELDTLSMVWLLEYWINTVATKKAIAV